MKKGKTISFIEEDNEDNTGYTLTVSVGDCTDQLVGAMMPPLQGIPYSRVSSEEESQQYIFPESREERFLDNNLLEFYKKKGYPLAGNKDA